MPIFDIEGMVKKELDKVQEVRKKMRAFLESGKIEEWCARHPTAVPLVKAEVETEIRKADKYYYILLDVLDGYTVTHGASDFDKWQDSLKEACDDIMRDEDKTESDPTEGD